MSSARRALLRAYAERVLAAPEPLSAALARCDREIAEAEAYTGPDGIGATLGSVDWRVERQIIEEKGE